MGELGTLKDTPLPELRLGVFPDCVGGLTWVNPAFGLTFSTDKAG